MSTKIIKLKSGFYILLLSAIGFFGLISFSSCKGKEKTSETTNQSNENINQKPITKYGVPANYQSQPQPTKYGAVRDDYKKIDE